MLKMNIIESSTVHGEAHAFLSKKNGKPQPPRFVVDYGKVNSLTLSDGYPIPSVNNILDNLSFGRYYSELDLASGYGQINLRKSDRPKSTFSTHFGLYQLLRLPVGLKTASSTF